MDTSWTFAAFGLCACFSAPGQGAPPQSLPEDRARGAATIAEVDLRSWLTTLTSEAYAGRGTGTDGFRRAAELVRDHFEQVGLEPAGDDGTFWQRVPWTLLEADPESTHLEIRNGDETVCRLTPGHGLHGQANSGEDATGEVVVVVIPGHDSSGLQDFDLEGKIALVWAPSVGSATRLARALRRAGPVAWVRVDDQACERYPALSGLSRPGRSAGNRAVRGRGLMPNRFYTTSGRLEQILKAAGKSLSQLGENDLLIELPGLRAELQVGIVESDAPAYNVIGILRGSDPGLRDEYVVVGSHLDHLGIQRGRIHPGADDDGSGTVGVMALARAFVRNPVRPPRSLLFVTFCGEEKGLIGSGFFTKKSPVPLSSIVAELQMDMIGRREESRDERAEDNLDSLHLIGTRKLSYDLHQLCVERNDQFAGFDLEWDEEDVFYRSDHFNFARQGVPIAFFFTGFHRDYHQPSDTVDKIDFEKLRRVASHVYDIAFELATAEARPLVDPERWTRLRRELRGRAPEKPAAPLRTK
jgi:hypothetical protein